MKINKTVPYVIFKANNETEFIKIQKFLFTKGYKWVNDMDVFVHKLITYPCFISNAPWSEKEEKEEIKNLQIRKNFNEFNNNIIFFSRYNTSFNLNVIRKEKLETLKELQNEI